MLRLKTGPWVPEPHGEKSVTLGWSVWIWEDRIRMLWVPQNCPNVDSLSYCRAKAGASITKAVMPIGRDVGASYCWYLTLSLHDVAEVGLHGGRWNMVFIFMVSRRLENWIGSCTVQYLSIIWNVFLAVFGFSLLVRIGKELWVLWLFEWVHQAAWLGICLEKR